MSIASEPRLSRATGPIDGLQLRRTTVGMYWEREARNRRTRITFQTYSPTNLGCLLSFATELRLPYTP